MRYIDKENKQLIIRKPVNTSTTKTTNIKGETIENIKYRTDIPNEVLALLLSKYGSYNPDDETLGEYINKMLDSKKYFLCFNDAGDKIFVSDDKDDNNASASMSIKKDISAYIYRFTISKRVFNFLKDNPTRKYYLSYVVDFSSDSDCLKNSVVGIRLD